MDWCHNEEAVRMKGLQKLISRIRSGEFKYGEKEEKPIDFARYNEAQVNELADMSDTIREIVGMAATMVNWMKRDCPGRSEEAASKTETDAFPKYGTKHNFRYSVLS